MPMINKIRPDHIKLKRAYEPPAPDDGTRILIDRLWPRGVKKADAAIDEWMKELAACALESAGSPQSQFSVLRSPATRPQPS
jgi:uncharacterized protein YeaO (DUF488 family)